MGHLTTEQRYTIAAMQKAGYRQSAIASAINKDKSVVSRELRRNCDARSGEYRADLAQRKYELRQKQKPKHQRFTVEIQEYVEAKLSEQYSPEQIVGAAKLAGKACVSHERIYQHIWEDKRAQGVLYQQLRSRGKRYRKRGNQKDSRGKIKERIGISERPEIVEERERFGDLEIDTIIGKGHKGAIVTINDRATGMLIMRKLAGKNAEELAQKTIEALRPWKEGLHTITSDNGKEFASHQQIADSLGIDFYFADPYHSWQRGSNENLNGLIRQYIPKKTDFSTISEAYIHQIETKLNNRPRKRFKFLTPLQVAKKKVAFIT